MKKIPHYFRKFLALITQAHSHYPALFVALSFLCGCGLALDGSRALWVPMTSLFLLAREKKRALFLLSLFLFGIGWTLMRYSFPKEETPICGQGTFIIKTVRPCITPFREEIQYQGILKEFAGKYKNIPITVKKVSLDPKHTYTIYGTLKRRSNHTFSFTPENKKLWRPSGRTFNFAGIRHQLKERVNDYFKTRIHSPLSCRLLSALATGNMESPALKHSFGQLGLQHLLAISGFHFGLLTYLLTLLLSPFAPSKGKSALTLLLVTAYFLYIGPSPSCLRTYCTVVLFLLSKLFGYRTNGLNLLGCAIILALIIDPFQITHLGFQFSYAVTFAILLFFPLCQRLFYPLLPKRSEETLGKMSPLHKHVYLLCAGVRATLSLNTAVHFVALPLILFSFGEFPLMSLFYNLFFPFAVALTLLLLLIAFILSPFPILATQLHILNGKYTSLFLPLTTHSPSHFQFYLHTPPIPMALLTILFTALFWGGIALKQHFASSELTESIF